MSLYCAVLKELYYFVKSYWKKYQEMALLKLIILGLIIGIFIAVAVPTAVPAVAILGDLFVKALKGIAPILVFVLVMNAMVQKMQMLVHL